MEKSEKCCAQIGCSIWEPGNWDGFRFTGPVAKTGIIGRERIFSTSQGLYHRFQSYPPLKPLPTDFSSLFWFCNFTPFLAPKSPPFLVYNRPFCSCCPFLQAHSVPQWESLFFLHFSKVPLTIDWCLLQTFAEIMRQCRLVAAQGRKQLDIRHCYCQVAI